MREDARKKRKADDRIDRKKRIRMENPTPPEEEKVDQQIERDELDGESTTENGRRKTFLKAGRKVHTKQTNIKTFFGQKSQIDKRSGALSITLEELAINPKEHSKLGLGGLPPIRCPVKPKTGMGQKIVTPPKKI